MVEKEMMKIKIPLLFSFTAALVYACTPPLPPEVLAGQAESTINCETANTIVDGPLDLESNFFLIADSLSAACPEHQVTFSIGDPSAEVIITDHTPTKAEIEFLNRRCPTSEVLVSPAYGIPATLSLQVTGLEGLALDANAVGGLLDGTITNWNDPIIQELNPDFILDSVPVIKLGSTEKSSAVLAMTSWAKEVGGANLEPSDTIRGEQNFSTLYEMASEMFNIEGSFGIVPLGTAVINGLNVANMVVNNGDILVPEPVYTMRAIATAEIDRTNPNQMVATIGYGGKVNEELSDPLIDPSNFKSGWPAIGIAHVMACESGTDNGALPFARFMIRGEGQGALETSGYTRLPLPIRLKAILALKTPLSPELLEQIPD
jgi:ABC-type phosphate transport system substrate-binding protein